MLKIITTIGIIQIFAIAVTLIRSKIIAVTLGPEGVGVISVIDQLVVTVAQVSAFSLPFAAVKFLSRSHSTSPEAFRRTYSSLLHILPLLTITSTTIVIGLIYVRPDLFGAGLTTYRALLIPALLSVPAITLHGFFSSALAAAQNSRASALMALLIAIVLTAAAYFGLSLRGIAGLYWGNLLAAIFVVIVLLHYLGRKFGVPLLGENPNLLQELRENRDMITFSLILYASSFMYPFALFVARYAVLSNFGEAEAGLLQAAIALSGSLRLVLGPANGLYLTPILNRQIPPEEKIGAALGFQKKLMVILAALAMPAVLFPQWSLTLLFSASFLKVSPIVFLFVIAYCIFLLGGVFEALVIGLDDLKVYGVISVSGHLTLGGFSWLLAPQFGITGVAVGFIISGMTVFLLNFARLAQQHRLSLPRRSLALISYSLFALFVAGAFFNQFDAWNLVVVAGKSIFYLFFLGSLLLFLSHEEFEQLVNKARSFLAQQKGARWTHRVGHVYQRITETFFA